MNDLKSLNSINADTGINFIMSFFKRIVYGMPEMTLLEANGFRSILFRERKRSERSGRPIVLVLLDISNLLRESFNKMILFEKISKAINSSTRDIDIKGWHSVHSVIGIIYCEVEIVKFNAVLSKLNRNLKERLGEKNFNLCEIQHLIYPSYSDTLALDEKTRGFRAYPQVV